MKTNEEIIQMLKPALDAILEIDNTAGNEIRVTLMKGYGGNPDVLTIDAWATGERVKAESFDKIVAKVKSITPESKRLAKIAYIEKQRLELEAELAQLKAP